MLCYQIMQSDLQDREITWTIESHNNTCVSAVENFLNREYNLNLPPKSENSNLTNQISGKNYYIPCSLELLNIPHETDLIPQNNIVAPSYGIIEDLFDRLEACRLAGIKMYFSERQYFSIPYVTKPKEWEFPADEDLKLDFVSPNQEESIDDFLEKELITPENTVAMLVDSLMTEQSPSMENITFLPVDKSCIELDFDLYTRSPDSDKKLDDEFFAEVIRSFTDVMARMVDWKASDSNASTITDGRIQSNFYACVLKKDTRQVFASDGVNPTYDGAWKMSFHIRIFVKISKAFKFHIRNQLLQSEDFCNLLRDLNLENDLESAFDRNALSNPAMLLGSMKKNGNSPHEFHTLYKVEYKSTNKYAFVRKNFEFKTVKETVKIGKKTQDVPRCNHNLVLETCLHYDGKFIKKYCLEPLEDIKNKITANVERFDTGNITDTDFKQYSQDVTNLTVRDFHANYYRYVLDIISPGRVCDYNTWRQVIIALANASQEYKPLAIWFSIRSYSQFMKGGMNHVNGIFDNAKRGQIVNNTTMARICAWAKLDNPEEFNKIQHYNMYSNLKKRIFERCGDLNHSDIANCLHDMFSQKFFCDEDAMKTRQPKVWREFITPEDNYDIEQCELYKWRAESGKPEALVLYMAEKLPQVLEEVIKFCQKQQESGKDTGEENKKNEIEYLKRIIGNVKKTQKNLGNTTFINQTMELSSFYFRKNRRGHEQRMDTDPDYIGVRNGVLKLRPHIELIQNYHDIPISKSASVDFIPYDTENPYIQKLEKVFLEIFEDDMETYEFWMMLLASGLDGREKNPTFFVQWFGNGSEGKSVLSAFDCAALRIMMPSNKNAGYVSIISPEWFSQIKEGCDTNLYSTKGARRIWSSENDKNMVLQMGKIKRMLSDTISGDEKYAVKDTWKVIAHIIVTTNYECIIEGMDYGIWRRTLFYRFKRQFLYENNSKLIYDPTNPNHRIINPDIMNSWTKDPKFLEAYFSIMVKYYIILGSKYNFDLNRVPKRIIDEDTRSYQLSQDKISEFIETRMIHLGKVYPGSLIDVLPIPILSLVDSYNKWFMQKHAKGADKKSASVAFIHHPVLKKYFSTGTKDPVLSEFRILEMNDTIENANTPPDRAVFEWNQRLFNLQALGAEAIKNIDAEFDKALDDEAEFTV